jgi:phosphoserine/homoserine phosphotransferase
LKIVCLDLEGVLVPEVWINFAEFTGIQQLRLTTRDVPDYDELMRNRLAILEENGLGLPQIQRVIERMEPLEGARAFLDRLRERYQVIILSDTYYEFAAPLIRKLGSPTLFCHSLQVAESGAITDYCLRQPDSKRKAVEALRTLEFRIIAVGDSYNDTSMLAEADAGILFRAPDNVTREFPRFPHTESYDDLDAKIDACADSL